MGGASEAGGIHMFADPRGGRSQDEAREGLGRGFHAHRLADPTPRVQGNTSVLSGIPRLSEFDTGSPQSR